MINNNRHTTLISFLLGLLAVVLLINITVLSLGLLAVLIQTHSPVVCPADRPYYVSNGVVDGLCYSSCNKIPFGHYVASSDSSVSPFTCIHVPQNHFLNNNETLDMTARLSSDGVVCRAEDVAMYFSWVSYEYDPVRMTGLNMSADLGYSRLKSCGNWQLISEIHNQRNFLNSHATIAVNNQAGVIVLAFKGTESDTKRWKETFIDWVFTGIDVLLTDCRLSPLCSGTKVHPRFQKSVLTIKNDIINLVQPFLQAGYLLLMTGHSKGAAMSTMATVLTTSSFTSVVPDIHRRIYNINFGSPMTGDKNFASFYDAFINDDRTMRFVDRFVEGSKTIDDLVTTMPGSALGYTHVKNPRYTRCEKKYFGNPTQIPGISFQLLSVSEYLPVSIGCHFQQCYMDGMLYSQPTIKPIHNSDLTCQHRLVVAPSQTNHSTSEISEQNNYQVLCHTSLQNE